MIQAVKKSYPIMDERNRPCTYPTFSSQVFMSGGINVDAFLSHNSIPKKGINYFTQQEKEEFAESIIEAMSADAINI